MKSAIILVGGEARRANGREKYFFRYRGKTFIERLVETLQATTDEIVLVARSREQCARFSSLAGVRCTADIRPGLGPIGGLQAGIREVSGDLVFVTACDMPCINEAVVGFLFQAIGEDDAAIPCWSREMFEPLHAVYRRTALAGYLESHASLSLRDMLTGIRTRFVPVEELRRFDPDLMTFTNINKLSDLENFTGRPGPAEESGPEAGAGHRNN